MFDADINRDHYSTFGRIGTILIATGIFGAVAGGIICWIVHSGSYLPGDPLKTLQYIGIGLAFLFFLFAELLVLFKDCITGKEGWKLHTKMVGVAMMIISLIVSIIIALICLF